MNMPTADSDFLELETWLLICLGQQIDVSKNQAYVEANKTSDPI